MVTPHRIHRELYEAPKYIVDPGDAGSIRVTEDLQYCDLVSGSSGETRTLEAPTKAGIRFVLRLLTDGGGDIAVYSAEGFNEAQTSLHMTFDTAGDLLSLISVTTTTGFRWQPEDGTVGVTPA